MFLNPFARPNTGAEDREREVVRAVRAHLIYGLPTRAEIRREFARSMKATYESTSYLSQELGVEVAAVITSEGVQYLAACRLPEAKGMPLIVDRTLAWGKVGGSREEAHKLVLDRLALHVHAWLKQALT